MKLWSPAKALAELSVRAKLRKASSDHERVLIRAREMRKALGMPETHALTGERRKRFEGVCGL